jgi:ankyrin repeat protein
VLGSRNPSTSQSLWDCAYDALKREARQKVEEYEELLSKELQNNTSASCELQVPSSTDPCADSASDIRLLQAIPPGAAKNLIRVADRQSCQEQLCAISRRGLQRMEEKKVKYTIAGHEFVLGDQIAQAAELVQWTKDWIGNAVQAAPAASVTWAGVCLILPLLTNPKTADEANGDGFTYVTTRMRYYTALEPLLLRLCRGSGISDDLVVEAQAHIVDLYKNILDFQIRSVLGFYRSWVGTVARDVVRHEKWEERRQAIVDLEATVNRDLTQMNSLESRQELEALNIIAKQSLGTMQQFLSISEEYLQVTRKQLQVQQDMYHHTLSKEEKQCHQLFRLTMANKDVTYEWYKDRVEERVKGTCEWFLSHEYFRTWLGQASGPLLVSADPGCGKSVLAKYLIDKVLPRSATVCYYFFKDQDQNTIRQALCALLHQLFSHKLFLIRHAMPEYSKNGQGLINTTVSLWDILEKAGQDPQAGPVIIVLDALDECAPSDLRDLVQKLRIRFHKDKQGNGSIKYILTSRPYSHILSEFQDLSDAFPNVHIPGDEKSSAISQEVNHVIKYKVEKLARRMNLKGEVKDHLTRRLLDMTHRTYLWVYLVFDYLETSDIKRTNKGIDCAIITLPKNVNEAYERILSKSKKHATVRKVLSLILAACRPLTLAEMNVAVNTDSSTRSIRDLDLEEEEDFKSHLRSWCGLFVSIHHDQVYLLHQTAREFLLAPLSPQSTRGAGPLLTSPKGWKQSINTQDAHKVLAEVCVVYLDFLNTERIPTDERAASPIIDNYPFLTYSAMYWGEHFRAARISHNSALIDFALAICDTDSKGYPVWSSVYWKSRYQSRPGSFNRLMIASYFGHEAVVKLLLDEGADVNSKDDSGWTSLSRPSVSGNKTVVKLLLDKGADINSKDDSGSTPLSKAAARGREAIVKLLLDKGADVNPKTNSGGTPLLQAIGFRHEALVKLLLDKGADVNYKDDSGSTSLSQAAACGHEAVVKLLLDEGADVNSKDDSGSTSLSQAAACGHEAVVTLLRLYLITQPK